jgi:hypothetical protein
MFKNAFILVTLLLLLSSVFAVRLVDPFSKELSSDGKDYVGSVVVGNTIELMFSKELTNKYQDIEMVSTLPEGFSYDVSSELETVKLFIHVPKTATVGDYPLTISLKGPGVSDKVSFYISVIDTGLAVSPSTKYEQVTNVDGSVTYNLFFVNNSDGDATFSITSNLPVAWMNSDKHSTEKFFKKVYLERNQTFEDSFTVYPRMQGTKEFLVSIDYANTTKDFSFLVTANPTLNSKLETVTYGLPFFSFSLLPSYFVNGLFSLVFLN